MRCCLHSLVKQVTRLLLIVLALPALAVEDEIMTLEEIIVEEPFDVRLQLPQPSAVNQIIARLRLHHESLRAADLEVAHRHPLTRVLDLTRYSPVPLGASEDRIDTFFISNAMRPDLNPREEDPLELRK